MRYVIARRGERLIKKRVDNLNKNEKKQKLHSIKSCYSFKKKCFISKKKFINRIMKFKRSGKSICGYAASAKSSTVLNFCKINNQHVKFIVDSTKEKIGKFTPGTHIPIVSVSYFRKNYPDVVILNSWNHKKEILKKEKIYKTRRKIYFSC